MSQKVFLSYAHEDRPLVEWEADTILIAGSDVFLDAKSLRYGSEWPKDLIQQIQAARRFLLFWSAHAARSDWVRNEYDEALRVRAERHDDLFLQIMKLDATPLPRPLESLHYLDRSREELLIVASEAKKSALLESGVRALFAAAIVKIERATPRTTRIIAEDAALLTSAKPVNECRRTRVTARRHSI